jgi:integrase
VQNGKRCGESKAAADFRRGTDSFVWPGDRPRRPLSSMTFLMLLRRMDRRDLTGHGFRSTFRDWVSETTEFSGEVAEMALAHAVANKVEAAYRRGICWRSGGN